jgi:pimeloyl-ACP methyl ester carboxylesterase
MGARPIFRSPEGERAILALYDALLARWPVPHRGLTVPTRHGDTFAIAGGDPSRPPLVLLHVASGNSAAWGEDFEKLSRSHRVYAVDIPGEPGRSAPNRLALDGPAYAEWLEDVLDGLEIPRARLLGYSQGGWTALRFATRSPERVERLVLIAPGGIAPPRISLLFKLLPFMLLGRLGREPLKRIIFGAQRLPREADEMMNEILRHFVPRTGKEYVFSDDELRRLTMPILLVTGSADAVRDSPRMVERMRRLVPQVQHEEFRGRGHLLLDLADDVGPFLSEDDPSLARRA